MKFSLAKAAPAALAFTALGALTVAGLPVTSTPAKAAVTEGNEPSAGKPRPTLPTTPKPTPRTTPKPAPKTTPKPGPGLAKPKRPNVLVFTADDMTVSDLEFMPHTRRLLVRQGTQMTEAVAPTPICVPARASLLTGQYTHNHGAYTIEGKGGGAAAFDDRNTLPVWLDRAGYDSFFVGKYLNGYGTRNPRYVPPGWDSWAASVDLTTYRFYGTTYNVNGSLQVQAAHNSDVLSRYTTNIINTRTRTSKPWFMWVNFVAPHHGGPAEADDPAGFKTTTPAGRHRNLFRKQALPDHPEMFARGGSPWSHADLTGDRAAVREVYQQRIESLQSVDEAVAAAVRRLRATGQLNRTYLMFTSDNGYLVGHHNRLGKLVPYDRAVRIPLVVRGPGIRKNHRTATPTTNPDLAVTIAAIAKAKPGRRVDGVNMLPYWRDKRTYDRPVPLEAYPVRGGKKRIYSGIRYGTHTYAVLPGGAEVLFDRAVDPGELRNLAGDADYAPVLTRMRAWEAKFRDCAAGSCPRAGSFRTR